MSPARRALVRRPGPDFGRAVVSMIDRCPVDVERAERQWEGLVATLEQAGWEAVEVVPEEGDPPCPDGVFVADAVVLVAGVVLLGRSPLESRVVERAAIRRTLAGLDRTVVDVRRPGTVDCGDVVPAGDVVYVGVGSRTNRAGFAQVARLARRAGRRAVPVPLHKAVQLDAGVTALPCGTVVGYPPLVDDPSVFDEFVPVPDAAGAQVVDLGEGRLLVGAGARRSLPTLRALGYEPVIVDVSEFEKREGTVNCLVAPI